MAGDAKRLLLVGPAWPYRGGIAHFGTALGERLRARGHAVDEMTFTRQYPSLLFPGKTQYEDGPAPGAPPQRLIDTLNPLSWVRAAGRADLDAVVFQHWMPFFAPAFGTMARLFARKGVPSTAVVHNALPHERRPGDLALSRYFLRACRGCLVMSEAVEADLRRLGVTAPVRRVEHPVYDTFGDPVPRAEARAALGLPAHAPVLLFFGFVRRYKGLHVLLEAMPEIVRRRPDTHLVVAGEFYDDEAPYRERVRALGLEAHVTFHADYIPGERVPLFFSAADLVVQPYVSATQSGVAQIAFHFERPLVVTDVGGLAEVVPDGRAGLVVPAEDPAALSAAVARFFDDALAERLAAGVRAQKARYSWDRLLDALEVLLATASAPATPPTAPPEAGVDVGR